MRVFGYARTKPYQLTVTYSQEVPIFPDMPIISGEISISIDGVLTVVRGYQWDGPSGPAFDTPDFMRASLVHDALYQLMREGRLPLYHRDMADNLLWQVARADGMPWARAIWCWAAVRMFGERHATPSMEVTS